MSLADPEQLGTVRQLDKACFALEFTESVQKRLGLDRPDVLLEIRAGMELWGVFYAAKGLEWDVWCDGLEEEELRAIDYAARAPLEAGYQLLSKCRRQDFKYVPEDE